MDTQRQNFYRAISTLNSLLVAVFILFSIDILNSVLLLRFNFFLILLIIGPLKIYCMAGISGCILETISREKLVFQFRRIHQNAKDFWPGFLIVFVIIFLIDIILAIPLPSLRIWRPVYFSLLGGVTAYVLALWTINRKYISPLGLPRRSIKVNLSFLIVIVFACLLELILVKVLNFIHIGGIYWRNILAFMLNNIHVFEFIFCSLYILGDYHEINEKFSLLKEIFLINPILGANVRGLALSRISPYPPFFVVLKALSPKTYKFREFNRVIWHERYYKNNALVCITCFTSNSYEAYKIAKEFRKRGSKVVMGGPHVTFLPNEALAFCDSVVIGQAESVWDQVIRDYENGTLKLKYNQPATEADYDKVHVELLNSPPSIVKDFLETMRGCKFRCHFCTIPDLNVGQVHIQSINSFVELIKKIVFLKSHVAFLDSNIYNDPGYAKELFVALKPLKIKWLGSCSIDIGKNKETLKLARESGCSQLEIGYEISTGSLEKNQGGKFAMAQKYIEYSKNIKQAGIKIRGQFIFGFDSDNLMALFALWKSCFLIMPQFTSVSLLTPLPGSGLYQQMLAQDRLINLNWRSFTCCQLTVRHPYLNPTLMFFFFPCMQIFFSITTSTIGLLILAVVLLNLGIKFIGLFFM